MRRFIAITAAFTVIMISACASDTKEERSDTSQPAARGAAGREDEQEIIRVPETGDEEVEEIELQPGDEAPKFALRDLEGNYELLTKWSGERLSRPASQPIRHVVLASFFATWCDPCMKELPHLQNLYEEYSSADIKFFLIDITEATRTVEGYENSPQVGPFLKEKGITIPVLVDVYGMTKKSYGVTTLPRLFIIDKFGKVRLIKQGFREAEDFEGELAGMIDELLADELQLKPDKTGAPAPESSKITEGSGSYSFYNFTYQRDSNQYAVVFSPPLPRDDATVIGAMLESINTIYGKNNVADLSPQLVPRSGTNLIKFEGRIEDFYFLLIKDYSGEVNGFSLWTE